MKFKIGIIGILLFAVLPIGAQQIIVDEFARLKKSIFRPGTVKTDKKQATLDFYTNEKGFTFIANGKEEVQAEEGDGKLTLLLPHRTGFIVIKHPDYGQMTWKVPKSVLKKKKRYKAYLYTNSPDKEFKNDKQWVVFYIRPRDVIVYIDSIVSPLRTGEAQFYLPVGKHAYRIESPFFETWQDTLSLTDSVRVEKRIELTPFYSYLTVNTAIPNSQISLDGHVIGNTRATSGHLMPGSYRLTVIKDSLCFYDAQVEIGKAEKKVIDQREGDWIPWKLGEAYAVDSLGNPITDVVQVFAPIHVKATDEDTEIWINREQVGKGEWKGMLATGFYAISTRKEGLESSTSFLWVDDDRPQTLNLFAPQATYGMLNIRSNEIDAEILLNDISVGYTPCIIRNLPANRDYVVRLRKPGYKEVKKTVRPHGNDLQDVILNLKKK